MSRQTGIVVAIEGVDLTGKTTLAQSIAELEGWRYFYTPTEPFSVIRKQVEVLRDYPTRFFYYLSCVVCAQIQLRELVKHVNVVIDRYIDSTFIMHETLGFDTTCVKRNGLEIIRPDVTIVLTADTAQRALRGKLRDGSQYDAAIEQQATTLDLAQKKFTELSHVRVLETSNLSIPSVYAQALEILKEEGVTCLPNSLSSSSRGVSSTRH